ncbi:MAG: hypothetical protein RBS77_05255 [Candidatus Moranbacteria bacterium]|nr:hypothetical protein [Candidatus Moranbacteria bacterium]
MKNNIKFLSLATVAVLSGISISSVQAVGPNKSDTMDERKAAVEDKKVEKMCTRLDNAISRLEEKIENEGTKLRERSENRVREMKELGTTKNDELEQRRTIRDENRERFFMELEDQTGDNQEKKAAVEKFRNTVESAIRTRREAIDAAKDDMNKGIELAIQARTSTMTALRNEFEKNISSAIAKAKNSCGDDASAEDLNNVMTQLKDDIKSARETHRVKVNEAKKVQATIQTLRETRKNEVKLAIENFKSTMKLAQEELRKTMVSQEVVE